MQFKWHGLSLFLIAAMSVVPAKAATYIPMSAKNPDAHAHQMTFSGRFRIVAADLNRVHADIVQPGVALQPLPSALPVCDPVPTVLNLTGTFEYHQALLSTDTAIQLGLPVANVNSSQNEMVVVRDYSKSVQCLATDQKTILIYGQAIRTIITVDDYDTKIGLSLAAIAASATLAGKNDQVNIQVLGFDNAAFAPIFSSIANQELNVDTYSKYADVESQFIKLTTDNGTALSVARLGVVPDNTGSTLQNSVVVAYALQEISNGNSCSTAKGNIDNITNDVSAGITSTYTIVADGCDSNSPSAAARAAARTDLMGFTVHY